MKKILLLIILLLFFITGCKNNKIIGKWTSEIGGYIYTFNDDETGYYEIGGNKRNFTYTINDNRISILFSGNTKTFETTFIIQDNILNIKDAFGNDTLYTRN